MWHGIPPWLHQAGWGLPWYRQSHTPKTPTDAHKWAATEEPFVPSAHPAKQAEIESLNSSLETAFNPSAPHLCLCPHQGTTMIKMLRSQPGELSEH